MKPPELSSESSATSNKTTGMQGARKRTVVIAAVLSSHFIVAGAETSLEAPAEFELRAQHLELEIDLARIEITIDDNEPPRVTLPPIILQPGQTARNLSASTVGGSVVLRGTVGHGDPVPRAIVSATISSSQTVRIVGSSLELTVVHEPDDEPVQQQIPPTDAVKKPVPGREAEAEANAIVVVVVDDSETRVEGASDVWIQAQGGSTEIAGTRGDLSIKLVTGFAQLTNHHGNLDLDATDSEVTIEKAAGAVVATIHGGSLSVLESLADLNAEATEAFIEIRSAPALTHITGSYSTIQVTAGARRGLRVTGSHLDLSIDDVENGISANLSGGSLSARSIEGRCTLDLRDDLDAVLSDLRGDVRITGKHGPTVELHRVSGHSNIDLDDAEVKFGDLGSLALQTNDSSVTGFGVRNITGLIAHNTSLDLTLPDLVGRTEIKLSGATQADLQLSTPCQIKAELGDGIIGDRVRVSGCLLDFDGAQKRQPRRGIDGRTPIRVTATMEDTSKLFVTAY